MSVGLCCPSGWYSLYIGDCISADASATDLWTGLKVSFPCFWLLALLLLRTFSAHCCLFPSESKVFSAFWPFLSLKQVTACFDISFLHLPIRRITSSWCYDGLWPQRVQQPNGYQMSLVTLGTGIIYCFIRFLFLLSLRRLWQYAAYQ